MNKFETVFYIILAVFMAVSANYISAIWASKESRISLWLLALVVISPFVFITFGLVTEKLGLALSSATVDSLLTISTILIGLIVLREWGSVNGYQYAGMLLAFIGIVLMHIQK